MGIALMTRENSSNSLDKNQIIKLMFEECLFLINRQGVYDSINLFNISLGEVLRNIGLKKEELEKEFIDFLFQDFCNKCYSYIGLKLSLFRSLNLDVSNIVDYIYNEIIENNSLLTGVVQDIEDGKFLLEKIYQFLRENGFYSVEDIKKSGSNNVQIQRGYITYSKKGFDLLVFEIKPLLLERIRTHRNNRITGDSD